MKFTRWFWDKCSKCPQNDLHMFKVKSTHMHTTHTHTHDAHIFIRLALRRVVFELPPYFQKSALNDPKMALTCLWSKVPIFIPHATTTFRFYSVLLYDEPFSSSGQILRKVHQMAWKEPCHIQGQKYVQSCNIHPWIPNLIFVRVFCDKPFLSYGPSSEKCTEWPQNDLDMFKVNSTHMDTTYT